MRKYRLLNNNRKESIVEATHFTIRPCGAVSFYRDEKLLEGSLRVYEGQTHRSVLFMAIPSGEWTSVDLIDG